MPRTRQPEPGLAGAVTSWARGASFGPSLDVAAQDIGEIAPGDFVRTVQAADRPVGQVSVVAPDPAVAAAACGRRRPPPRGTVVAGEASTTAEVAPVVRLDGHVPVRGGARSPPRRRRSSGAM